MTEQTTETTEQTTAQEATGADVSAPEAVEAPTDPAPEEAAQEAEEQDDDKGNPNAEAKKYRLRLRETEAELESTRAAVEALQDRVLTSTLAEGIDVIPTRGNIVQNPDGTPKPRTVSLNHQDDLFTIGGVEKSDVFTDGVPDRQKLSEAVGALYEQRPELFREGRPGDPIHQPITSAGNMPSHDPTKTGGGWSDVIRNRG